MSENALTTDAPADARCEYGNPIKAVGHMFRHLFDFSGRATRKEFIMSMVGFAGLCCVSFWGVAALDLDDILLPLFFVSVLSLTSLIIRRYHDFGYDGVRVVIIMLIFPLWMFSIPFLVIECMLRASQEGGNEYGMSSRYPALDSLPVRMFPVKKSFGCLGWGCLCELGLPIVMWLLVSWLMRPCVTQAQYSGRVLPVVDKIRMCIGIYVYDRGMLPGLGAVGAGNNGVYMSPVQTFVRNQVVSGGEYVPGYCSNDYQTVIPVGGGDQSQPQARHFAYDVGLQASDLHDNTCKPAGYRYWAAVLSSNVYAYCVGYFPSDDCQLESGTGYATLEICSASLSLRRTAIWERYKPADSMRIVLRPATNSIETAQTAGEGTCWLGHPELYLSDDPENAERGIRELEDAGWSFEKRR